MPLITRDKIGMLRTICFSLSLLYLGYVYYINGARKINDIIMHKQIQSLKNHTRIDGLILGGSNALFGLSAKQLSMKSGHVFMNLSLYNEGGNIDNYSRYIRTASKQLNRDEIQWIIYSTIDFYSPNIKENAVGINGEKRGIENFIIPNVSLLSLIFRRFDRGIAEPNVVIGDYGDKVFTVPERWGFKNDTLIRPNKIAFFKKVMLINQVFKGIFPQAKIIFVIPPTLSSQVPLFRKYSSSISKDLRRMEINVVAQYFQQYDMSFWVDNRHVNDKGRIWRTQDLYDSLKFYGLIH